MTDRAAPALPVRVWDLVCRHIDGMVIGSTMAALDQRGALKLLAAAPRTGFGELRSQLNASPGYLHVAVRLLADQGFVTCTGEPGTDDLIVTPTPPGRTVMTTFAPAYTAAASFLPLAAHIEELIYDPPSAPPSLGTFADLMRREWDLPDPVGPPRRQVLTHLNGHLLAPVMYAMTRRGTLAAGTLIALDRPGLRHAAQILELQGWAQIAGDSAKLTAEGEVAAAMARQYRYPMVYLSLLRQVPELLFGNPRPVQDPDEAGSGTETHLDRELDLRFSGDVFAAVCRTPFLEIALPLFDREPVSGQPALVVDMGCGDGALLAALYEAVLSRTARGHHIEEFPLLMVGADPSQVARRVASSRLAAAGVPHLILDGDIADPGRLIRALAARNLDARDALHVCKSAIHDRAYRPPEPLTPGDAIPSAPADAPTPSVPATMPVPATPPVSAAMPVLATPPISATPPVSSCAFAQPDGSAIPATAMALNLAGFFRDWLPVTHKHGWIVIEAHAAPAATAARLIGRTVATALDATHGYSCQYPVEPEVFAWAAAAAGFSSRQHAEPAARALGHTILTIDHFVTSPAQTRLADA